MMIAPGVGILVMLGIESDGVARGVETRSVLVSPDSWFVVGPCSLDEGIIWDSVAIEVWIGRSGEVVGNDSGWFVA